MTLSTLNIAAQSADAAIEHEKQKLAQIIADEQNAQRELDANHREQEQLRRTEQQISNYLATKGRDRNAQEQRIQQAEDALRDQAEALLKLMANFELEVPQPAVAPAQQTAPDVLSGGEVQQTGREAVYAQQAAENGPPADMTAPHRVLEDPTQTAVLPPNPNGDLIGSDPHGSPVEAQEIEHRTGSQPRGRKR